MLSCQFASGYCLQGEIGKMIYSFYFFSFNFFLSPSANDTRWQIGNAASLSHTGTTDASFDF
jgi:hypothetical protein